MKRIVVLILTLVFCNHIKAQNLPNDCNNALTICGNGTFVSNATGPGLIENENTACQGGEKNSLWLKINIAQNGTLGFNLIPNDSSILVDYDFYVYGPNKTCVSKGSAIRCCTTNPNLAGLTSNETGMNDSTIQTTGGPGASGNGYVRWLDVQVGETYYISIDRPEGDGGFSLEWIGSATAGTGAFPPPPVANAIPEYVTCSSTPDTGIFFFDDVFKSTINSDPFNKVEIFKSQQDAIDNKDAMPTISFNTINPQKVYTRVTNLITNCFSIGDFNLVVSNLPTASINVSSTAICLGESVDVIFNGTPNATLEYSINNGTILTTLLDATGKYILENYPTINTNYKLLSASIIDASGITSCKEAYNITKTVDILPVPTASISGTTTICENTKTDITFNGTPDATVTYSVDGFETTVVLNATGNAIITTPPLTSNSTYQLVSITSTGATPCSQLLSESVTIAVNPLPTATISGDATICSGSTTDITFTGTPNATVNYTVDGVSASVILDATGNAVVPTPTLTTNSTYALVSVVSSCTETLSGSVTVSVNSVLTASISGTTTICSGSSTAITFTGTPNVIVNYTVDAIPAAVKLDNTGKGIVTTPILSSNSIYELVNVTSAGNPPCVELLTGSAIVTVIPSPTVTISGTTTICSGTSATIIFAGTPNATVTYTVDLVTKTIVLDASGNGIVITPILTANSIYELVSVSETVTPFCSQPQAGKAEIKVNPLPIASISGTSTICAGTSTDITFIGTPNAIVNYTVDSVNASVVLDASGNGKITTPKLTTKSTYSLVSVSTFGATTCSQTQTGSAIITVKPYATITATPSSESICSGLTTNIVLKSSNSATTFTWIANTNTVTGATNGNGALIAQNLSSIGNVSGVVIYTVTPVTNGCDELPFDVLVNVSPKPTVTANVAKNAICSGETTAISITSSIPSTTFSWTVVQNNATGASSGIGNSINQPLTATGITEGTVTYTITPNTNGCQGTPITETITVIPAPIAKAISSATQICSEEYTDIDLISSLAGTTFTWTVVQNGVSGASNGSGDFITQKLSLTSFSNGTVVYSILPTVNGCDGKIIDIIINVNKLPVTNLQDGAICVDLNGLPVQTYTLESNLEKPSHNFEWFLDGIVITGANNNFYVASKTGTYGVVVTNITTGCKSSLDTAIVSESVPGNALTITQTQPFSSNAIITATVTGGNGSYLYQLDDGEFQKYNDFTNVASGAHVVNAIDTNGCTNLSGNIYIVGYPKFFTPNGDGINDTWNITDLDNLIYKKITIFDRYGKLLIQLNPNSNGWDGRFNGKNLPSTDYWFVFDYSLNGEDQLLRSHFSLKR